MRLVLVFSFALLCMSDDRKSRILLNDPNYVIHEELNSMKLLIQNLTSEVSILKAEKESQRLRTQNLAADIVNLRKTTQNLESAMNLVSAKSSQGNGGALFVRWGRKTCPDNESEVVYSGYIGGSDYGDTGGSSETLCLTPNPVFTGKTLQDKYTGHLYGAEYQGLNFFASNANDEDAPCTICRSRTRVTKLIIPGTNVCENGWKKEYSGYLAGNHYEWAGPEQWICIDEQPEFLPGGSSNSDGRVLHPVTTVCGSLQCPPYQNNKAVTCVVCTK